MKHGILDRGVFLKRENEREKLKMAGGAWSINLDELPDEAIAIAYSTTERLYAITRLKAFTHGFERMLGGERKLIVPLKHWKTKELE